MFCQVFVKNEGKSLVQFNFYFKTRTSVTQYLSLTLNLMLKTLECKTVVQFIRHY